jgi:hypothetical protein
MSAKPALATSAVKIRLPRREGMCSEMVTCRAGRVRIAQGHTCTCVW